MPCVSVLNTFKYFGYLPTKGAVKQREHRHLFMIPLQSVTLMSSTCSPPKNIFAPQGATPWKQYIYKGAEISFRPITETIFSLRPCKRKIQVNTFMASSAGMEVFCTCAPRENESVPHRPRNDLSSWANSACAPLKVRPFDVWHKLQPLSDSLAIRLAGGFFCGWISSAAAPQMVFYFGNILICDVWRSRWTPAVVCSACAENVALSVQKRAVAGR